MKREISIEQFGVERIKELRELSIQTYQDTFGKQNNEANMKSYLEEAYNIPKLKTELTNPYSEFYFIYYRNECAGYLKINIMDAQTEAMGDDYLEVERIYLKLDYQGKHLGRTLIVAATEIAKNKGKQKIWLGVWEKNEKALAFYNKMGFVKTGQHDFVMGDDAQTDYIMEKSV